MKSTKTIQVKHCDTCRKKCGYSCLKCGRDWCVLCLRKNAAYYWDSVGMGVVVGVYCKPCDMELSQTNSDPLHNACLEIQRLRAEWDGIQKEYDERARAAEETLKRLLTRAGRGERDATP